MKRRWIIVFAALAIVSLVVDFLLRSEETYSDFPWTNLLGVFTLFVFVSCLAIVIISKLIGHYWLQKKEGYYDRHDDDK